MWQCIFAAVLLSYSCCATDPAFLVTFPTVIDAGSLATLCANLLYPNETLLMTVLLNNDEGSKILFKESTDTAMFHCLDFRAPNVEKDSVQTIRVEVKGQAFQLADERKVLFKPVLPITFIQTDKPVYKPGQMVNFRVITMNTKFVPIVQWYDMVELQDVNSNRIDQWLNVSSYDKIVQLSFPLSSEAPVGTYSLIVSVGEQRTVQSFTVMEYVLPRFEVTVKAAPEVNAVEPQVSVAVCGTYTYGQPVAGNAKLQLCRPPYSWVQNISSQCQNRSVQLDKGGCASGAFNMTFFLNFKDGYEDTLSLAVDVEEQGTGISLPGTASISINYIAGTITFVDTPVTYVPGSSRIDGKVQLVDYKNVPIAGKTVYLYKDFQDPSVSFLNVTTDQDGMAKFSVSLAGVSDTIQLKASYYPPSADVLYWPHTVFYQAAMQAISQKTEDTLQSSLAVQNKDKPLTCGTVVPININYTIVEETGGNLLQIIYLVLSKGAIVQSGFANIMWQGTNTDGEVSFMLTVAPELAPMVRVVAYTVLPSETAIAASMDFPTEKCFKHKVSMAFTPNSTVPGQDIQMTVLANPGALCGLSVVDQSVLLLDPKNRLDADKIYNMLPAKENYYYIAEDPEVCLEVRPKRTITSQEVDTRSVFQSAGLKLATNLFVSMPSCLTFKGRRYDYGFRGPMFFAMAKSENVPSPGVGTPLETVRVFFPETWIWTLVEVGKSGSTVVPVTAPDTITTWDTCAFCLSDTGLGLAPPVTLTVFQPFFLDLTLPYSIVRGETFVLKATVFNYLSECIVVRVTALPSQEYSLEPCAQCQYTSCVCASETKTFRWNMQGSALGAVNVSVRAEAVAGTCMNKNAVTLDKGRIDTIVRTLLVKAEGQERTDTYSWLLCPNGTAVKQEVVLRPPANTVAGSARASVSVLGDVLGRALQNMGDLLSMPYGCGEQNMAILAPDIYILQYLKSTKQLTPAVLNKATDFLRSGYQRQLNYKDSSGYYSTFPGGSGSNWLTAFVVRSFAEAQEFIYIDPKNNEDSVTWLLTTQKNDGCFKTVGKLIHTAMQGGVVDDVTLTAFIVAAFLESHISNPALNLSLACLTSDTTYLRSTYTAALMAYTFSLAGKYDKRAQLMARLKTLATADGTSLYWSQSSSVTSDPLSVEMTSYVLLAVLHASPLTAADLGYATRIVRWLAKRQNVNGGFLSTQDTVVALQALSLYSTLVQNPGGASTVTVQSPKKQQLIFNVNPSNKLLYQKRSLQDVTGPYSIVAQGTQCVSVQVTLHYNVPVKAVRSAFSITPTVESKCSPIATLTLNLQVQYTGMRETTNMVLIDIELLSGFVPDQTSLNELRAAEMVERVDSNDDSVLLYLREVPRKTPLSYSLKLIQQLWIGNRKQATIRIYDYYHPNETTTVAYTSGCK
ncbi:alpha-2-macroglobulin-like protein 1 [Brienomyrus brachyistius]|uniref:alpha-2-macroglobulin-like protein 1 n=1 Tax=Brienomyrus brachyistius TaxID=42636 RepID=UPI0020B31F89|nr:alpha-2-macroglobulin-like protein 1 [Brienomyrus brachyistius]